MGQTFLIKHMIQQTFNGLGIAPKILEILAQNNFSTPTPIQLRSIPHALEGKDIMGIAQTGTGKTLAFGVPMIQRLATHKGRGLIILPTRELAVQVEESLHKIGHLLGLKTAVLIGGENMNKQIRQLRASPHIIIATPGRLIDHLEQKTVHLDRVNVLVLDEADRMLDMGFSPQIKRILQSVPKERQTMLFSATMPAEIVSIASSYMKLPVRVEVVPQGTLASNVTQELFFVHREYKISLLESLLKEYAGTVLVFCRTKFGAKKVAHSVRGMGTTSAEIHSNRSLNQRLEALNGFKSGKYRVLVATDIAARGIDVTGIEVVINYDLPEQPSDYVHRIGRTGRAELTGHAVSFATPEQKYDVRAIERLIKKQLPVSVLPKLAPRAKESPAFEDRNRGRGTSKFSRFSRPKFAPTSQPDLNTARGESGKGYFIAKPRKNFAHRSKPAFGNRRQNQGHKTSYYNNQF